MYATCSYLEAQEREILQYTQDYRPCLPVVCKQTLSYFTSFISTIAKNQRIPYYE